MLMCARLLSTGTYALCVHCFLHWLGTAVGSRAPPRSHESLGGCSLGSSARREGTASI